MRKIRIISKKPIIPESKVQNAVLRFLTLAKIPHNRVNGAQLTVKGKNKRGKEVSRVVRCNSINGKSDIEAWVYAEKDDIKIPITIYIEVKASSGGRQSADQKKFQKTIEDTGGFYFIVKSIEDIKQALQNVKAELESRLPGFKVPLRFL